MIPLAHGMHNPQKKHDNAKVSRLSRFRRRAGQRHVGHRRWFGGSAGARTARPHHGHHSPLPLCDLAPFDVVTCPSRLSASRQVGEVAHAEPQSPPRMPPRRTDEIDEVDEPPPQAHTALLEHSCIFRRCRFPAHKLPSGLPCVVRRFRRHCRLRRCAASRRRENGQWILAVYQISSISTRRPLFHNSPITHQPRSKTCQTSQSSSNSSIREASMKSVKRKTDRPFLFHGWVAVAMETAPTTHGVSFPMKANT